MNKKIALACLLSFLLIYRILTITNFNTETNDEVGSVFTKIVELRKSSENSSTSYVTCFHQKSSNGSFPIFPTTADRENLERARSVFFLETACSEKESQFSCRQACAVESAAKLNPNRTVYLLFVSPFPASQRAKYLLEYAASYSNVKVRRIQFDDFIKKTPIEHWYSDDIFKKSPWALIDMSDMLRHLTLWKFGGTYLDLDVILTKPLGDLLNFMVAQDDNLVASGVYGTSGEGIGRKISDACVDDMMLHFDEYVWGHIGPALMTRVVQNLCNDRTIKDVIKSKGCHGLKLLPPKDFQPWDYLDWEKYFTKKNMTETMKRIRKARGVHLWNKLSSSKILKRTDKVPMTLLAAKYCPRVFQNCGPLF